MRGNDRSPDDQRRAWTLRLIEEFKQVCHTYRLKVPVPAIQLMATDRLLGRWDGESQCLFVSEKLIAGYPWYVVTEVLKHEMAHYLVEIGFVENERRHLGLRARESADQTGEMSPDGPHGASFQAACDRLGVERWARAAAIDIGDGVEGGAGRQGGLLDYDALYRLDQDSGRLQERVAKLLNLSNSSNEHEARLAMAKARELQRQHNLRAIGGPAAGDEFISMQFGFGKARTDAVTTRICSLLTKFFFVDVVHVSYFDARQMRDCRGFEVLGTRGNVVMAEYVFHFLRRQVDQLWGEFRRVAGAGGATRKKSFQLGLLHGFERYLQQAVPGEGGQDGSPGTAASEGRGREEKSLRLYEDRLRLYIESRFPRLRTTSSRGARVHGAVFAAGSAAGEKIRIRKPLGGGGAPGFGGYLD